MAWVVGKWWELVVMLHRSPSDRFFDGRFIDKSRSRETSPFGQPAAVHLAASQAARLSASRGNSQVKWWIWRGTLPHETACKAGAFLVEPHPPGAQWHAALVLPQAWVVLETSLCWLARGITAVSNGAASRLRSGISTMASSRLSYWTMAA